jgi:hypothetical protein
MTRLNHAVIEKITQARAANPPKVHSPIPEKRPISIEQLNANEPPKVAAKPAPDFWWQNQMTKKTSR